MTDMDLKNFVIALMKMHAAGDWMDIDGGDMDELYRRHGFSVDRPATKEDAEKEWCQEYDIEEGDIASFWTPEALELLRSEP